MTAPAESRSEAACSHLFTERHDEFTFGNDTVTALGAFRLFSGKSSQD